MTLMNFNESEKCFTNKSQTNFYFSNSLLKWVYKLFILIISSLFWMTYIFHKTIFFLTCVCVCVYSIWSHSFLQREWEQSTSTRTMWRHHMQWSGKLQKSLDRSVDLCLLVYILLISNTSYLIKHSLSHSRLCARWPVQQYFWLSGGGTLWTMYVLSWLRLWWRARVWFWWPNLPKPVPDGGVRLQEWHTDRADALQPLPTE